MAETATSSWYRAGTVSINSGSTTVNGVNTRWATAGINPGASFRIDGLPDDYEVAEVVSDTRLTLVNPYYGSNISGKTYSIDRNFQSTSNAEIARKVVDMLGKYEKYIDDDMHTVQGESAFDIAKRLGKTTAATEAEWVEALKNGEEYVALKETVAALTANEAGNHNANYIEKDAGLFTAEISANIRNGSFKNLYPGHYFSFSAVPYEYYWPTSDTTAQSGKTYYADAIGTPLDTQPEAGSDISGNEYTEKFSATHTGSFMTGHLDYYLGCGDTKLATHSALMFPTNQLFTCCMNKTNTTAGGYPGTYYRKYAMARANAIVKACFGADHVLSHRICLPNAFNANGIATGDAWHTSICDAMNEFMVYGCRHFGPSYEWTADSYLFTESRSQIAAFAHKPSLAVPPSGQWRWLRDPVSAAYFALVNHVGHSGRNDASHVGGVWPAFLIY